jgi:Xaa-Pro aminopeptidase
VGRTGGVIADVLNENGLAKGTIGVVGLERYGPWHPEGIVPYMLWNTVLAGLPDAEFRSVGSSFGRLIAPLGEEEIAVVRYSAGIGDAMVEAMVEATAPGVSENEVYAAGMAAAHAHGTVVPMMLIASGPNAMGGGPPRWSYRPEAPRVLQDGDIVRAEVFCNFGMRATQHQVTMAIGEVHEDFERAAVVAREAYDAGLRALRPKRTFGELVDEMRKPVEKAGGLLNRPIIHTMNPFSSRGGGFPTTSSDMELKPGMTFAFEPHCAFGPRKVSLGGTVIVGNDEPIELNPYTAQLLHAGTTTRAQA